MVQDEFPIADLYPGAPYHMKNAASIVDLHKVFPLTGRIQRMYAYVHLDHQVLQSEKSLP